MEKKGIRNIILGGALAAGLGVAVERGRVEDTEKDMPPEKVVIKKTLQPHRESDFLIIPEQTINGGKKEVNIDTAPPEDAEEDQESLNKYDDYDPRIIKAMEKIFPGIKTDLDDDDIFRRIRMGDYFLDRNVGAEESYSLKKWVSDDLNYEQDSLQFHVIGDMIKITNLPDDLFLLEMSGADLQSFLDEAHLPEAILEYVKLKENLNDSQYDSYIKSGGNYVESARLKNYYEARLRQLKEMKTQKWNYVPTEKKYQNIIDDAIRDTLIYLKNIEEDIAKIQL